METTILRTKTSQDPHHDMIDLLFCILDAQLGGQYSLADAQKAAALAPGMEQVVTALELQDAKDTAPVEKGKGGAVGFVRMRGGAGGRQQQLEPAWRRQQQHPRRLSAKPLPEWGAVMALSYVKIGPG
jgi:hypothetical protein